MEREDAGCCSSEKKRFQGEKVAEKEGEHQRKKRKKKETKGKSFLSRFNITSGLTYKPLFIHFLLFLWLDLLRFLSGSTFF